MENSTDWQFVIPLCKEDLLKSIDGQYYIESILDINTCWDNLKGIKKDISTKGCTCILQHFNVLYSILCEKEINFSQLQELYDGVLARMIKDISTFAREALQVHADDVDSKQEAVNVIKMNLYIFSLFEKCYEDKLSFKSENFIAEPKRMKGTKSKVKVAKPEEIWDWNSEKKIAFSHILALLQEKISTLWPSGVVEEPLVNLIGNCCYKAFENQEIGQSKLKPLRDLVSQVMAVLVASYNHGLSFIPKIVELMKQHEHVASSISSTVIIMATEFNCVTVIPKLLKELNTVVQEEDVPGLAKSAATFITEIAENKPELLIPCIKILCRNLVLEPYVIRNATLLAFCEIILKCFSTEHLSDEDKETRNRLLKFLLNHLRDQNSYVRSKVLQLWSKLAAAHIIPKDQFMNVLQAAKKRISDKSSFAVKSAIQFFTVILKENPYAGRLNIADMRGQLLQAKTLLNKINTKRTLSKEESWAHMEVDLILEINNQVPNLENESEEVMVSSQSVDVGDVLLIITKLLHGKHFAEAIALLKQSELQFPGAQEIRCNLDKKTDLVEYYTATLKKIFTITEGTDKVTLEFDSCKDEYNKQKLVVEYIEESINFTLLMNEVGKEINLILKSKSVMGVSEAIEYFTTAYQFGLEDSKRVMRQILLLVRCDQQVIKDAVAAAHKKLYLTSCQKTAKARATQVAHRLINLVKDLDLEQKGALEDLINLWFQNDELDKEFIQVLWEKFDKKLDTVTEEESISALILLDMMAYKNPSLAASNIETVINTGFSNNADLMTVEYSCKMLAKLTLIKKDGKPMRLPKDHELFDKIIDILVKNFGNADVKGYKPMSLAAVTMISKICCYPEKILDTILNTLYGKLFDTVENIEKGDSEMLDSNAFSIKEHLLERLLLIHGEILFRKWQYLNNDVVNSLSKTAQKNALNDCENGDMDEFEAECQDAENDALICTVNELCEELIMDDTSIDAHIRDLVVKVCISTKDQFSNTLKAGAAITLAKYMMVSQSFCEDKIQLYVTLMEKSKEEIVRSNLVLAFGDLLVRYPNVIEPWNSHLFSRLRDDCTLVRKNTVVVICHLITREMIKMRGHVAEVCLSLEDPEPSIAEQVHSLFIDLSRKGNTLYNIIPDIISRLTNPERSETITVDIFERILRFILGLIGKEKHCELLVEKLCTRLCESDDERQWRDLSFCLNQLNHNEKCLKKIIEALPQFNERLLCNEVHNCVVNIFNTAQKSSKQNLKDIASEGLAKIEELLTCKDKENPKDKSTSSEDTFLPPAKVSSTPSITHKTRSARKAKKTRF